jgi:hypothetical protein
VRAPVAVGLGSLDQASFKEIRAEADGVRLHALALDRPFGGDPVDSCMWVTDFLQHLEYPPGYRVQAVVAARLEVQNNGFRSERTVNHVLRDAVVLVQQLRGRLRLRRRHYIGPDR